MAEIIHAFGVVSSSEEHHNKESMRLLEGLMERVRSGEIVSLAVVIVRNDGALNTAWSTTDSRWRLMAGCDFLKRDLMELKDG